MSGTDSEAACRRGRDLPNDSASAALIPLWRLPIFGDKIREAPAFLVPRLTEMANELSGTDVTAVSTMSARMRWLPSRQ